MRSLKSRGQWGCWVVGACYERGRSTGLILFGNFWQLGTKSIQHSKSSQVYLYGPISNVSQRDLQAQNINPAQDLHNNANLPQTPKAQNLPTGIQETKEEKLLPQIIAQGRWLKQKKKNPILKSVFHIASGPERRGRGFSISDRSNCGGFDVF